MRRQYIDWLRGIAVVAMIEWHVIDAWSVHEGREGVGWATIIIIGGYAAPLFLFLAGVAVPLAIGARQRRGASLADAAWSVQKRGWQVFGLAHLFRFQSFLLNPGAQWSSLLKPDILNILGLALVATSWLCGRVMESPRRSRWLFGVAAAIVLLTPYSRMWWWPTLLPPRLEAYIRPAGNMGVFALFPWAAYVPLGARIGLQLLRAGDEARERAVLVKFGIAGLVAVVLGSTGFLLVKGSTPAFWLGPYADILFKVGVMTTLLAASRAIVRAEPAWITSSLVLLGQTSLFVYWVHVELAYGVWSYPLHYALPIPVAIAAFAGVLVLMYFAAKWWASRPKGLALAFVKSSSRQIERARGPRNGRATLDVNH